jgi:hypothetical protein
MNIETPARPGPVSHKLVSLCSSLALVAAASLAASAAVAQGIPATDRTVRAGAQTAPESATTSASASKPVPTLYRAQVIVDGSRLEIRANNSSLNGILRTLSQQTGMQITGGVLDQRVFGTYGPGPADQVLSQLLEDTATNMILRQSSTGSLGELILSPRLGGPSPPNPSTFRDEAEMAQTGTPGAAPDQPSVSPQPAPRVPPLPFTRPAMPPAATDPMQTSVTPVPQGIVEPPLVSPATEPGTTPGPTTQKTGLSDTTSGRTTPSTPDTPKTPQQIYEELQKLRQQQSPPQ